MITKAANLVKKSSKIEDTWLNASITKEKSEPIEKNLKPHTRNLCVMNAEKNSIEIIIFDNNLKDHQK